jgi:protein TonB
MKHVVRITLISLPIIALFSVLLGLPITFPVDTSDPPTVKQAVIHLTPPQVPIDKEQPQVQPQTETVSQEKLADETSVQAVETPNVTPRETVDRPQQAAVVSEEVQVGDPEHFYEVDEVTVLPSFDRALVINQIQYPAGAKRRGIEAQVLLRLFISVSGTIDDIVILEDPGYGFAEAAIRAFDGVIFTPARMGSRAVAVTIVFPLQFQLES